MRAKRPSHDSLTGLIQQVYEAAADAQQWERVLVRLAESVNGTAAHFLHHDLSSSGSVSVSARHDPEVLRLYNEHFHRVDPLAISPRARASIVGDVATDEMLVLRPDLKRTEYFNDFSARHDVTRLMSVLLRKDAASTSIVTILRGERDTPFDGQAVRFLRAMAPHLRRAVQIHRRIHSVEREAATASDVLDALPVAVLVVDTDAKVVLANRRGRALLAASDGLSVDRGRLSAARPDDTRRLRGLCAAVTATRVTVPRHPGGAMRLGRPSGRPALEALVTPSPPTAPLGAAGEPTTALVFVNDPSEQPLPDKARLQRYYRLTPAESDVAHRLAAGFSLEQIAEQRGTAIATVQHQNKQILAKTGARHRTELLRQLSALWPPLAGESRRE